LEANGLPELLTDFAGERQRMVEEQLCPRGIDDPRVLAVFESTPRHLFVPEESRPWAYADSPQSIGFGQTISQPFIVALMTQLLHLTGSERVLEVGAGSGYQAAILAQLVADVDTVEFIPELAERAACTLAELGLDNVHVHSGDGSEGWPACAPYDAILVAAAAPHVPPPLLEQLAAHGRLILPVGRHGTQELQLWQREQGTFEHKAIIPVAFVPLHGRHGWPREER
jgi:protein-L-isoaspartate(D-aspartate) O-methyltransferase